MREHYGSHNQDCQCSSCQSLNLADFSNRFQKIPLNLTNDFLTRIYNNVSKSTDVDDIMWREYYSRLRQFAEAGYGKKLTNPKDFAEFKMMESIRRNLSHFAGHKVQTATQELLSLKDLPISDYLDQGRKLMKFHNKNYLQAEVQSAMAAADSARRWRAFQERKSIYPNIRYETAGDERVRESHAVLDELVYPVDHPFWDNFMPPNGYRCRCIVIQTDEPTKEGDFDFEPPKGFRNNAGKTGLIFDREHPYFSNTEAVSKGIEKNAEKLRAEWEATEVKRLANNFVGESLQMSAKSKATVTKSTITKTFQNEHTEQAVKNSLLAFLAGIIPSLRFAKNTEEGTYYILKLFGSKFYFKVITDGNKTILDSITNKIT